MCQTLSTEFMDDYYDRLDKEYIIMNQKLSISVVSDNNLCGDRIIHRLSANPSWNCSRFNDTKKFLSS